MAVTYGEFTRLANHVYSVSREATLHCASAIRNAAKAGRSPEDGACDRYAKAEANHRRLGLQWAWTAALLLAVGVASAQQETPSSGEDNPPSPSLPPLPPPTAAQLERGRELLDKIVYVAGHVPLTDAAAVLEVFGFSDLRTIVFPKYTSVAPKGKGGESAIPQELLGTGFDSIEVRSRMLVLPPQVWAWLGGRFSLTETCVSIDAVRELFTPLASKVESRRILDIHPVPRPKPLHSTGDLAFSLIQHPFSRSAVISFRFEYQTCATRFSLTHVLPSEENTP
ncbi:MAG: hypothetical protein JNL84_11685 [Candidatus Accumulibacter sp.]|nr:hypothetical protein [Accumulibacter sp.]